MDLRGKKTNENLIIYTTLFSLAFFYSFGIENFIDSDMQGYFTNAFYMTNYGMEGVGGYPNQLFGLFLYWGYHLTNNWYGLSNILFFPLYLFGVYSLYAVLNYFIKNNYASLLFTILFLLVSKSSEFAISFYSYIVYFFFFISTIYLCLYHSKNIYLIGFYFAIGTLFRNQLITFLPFIPFIINPKLSKKYYLKNIAILLLALVIVQLGYEVIRNITIHQKQEGVSFKFYFHEIYINLLRSIIFTSIGIKLFLKYNFYHYYFYLVTIPCFFMLNKNFARTNTYKPLLIVFLILALFIYFIPAIMYLNIALVRTGFHYFTLLSRYSFIMIALLIPIYYFIIKEQTFIKLKNIIVYMLIVLLLLPILSLDKAPIFVKNTFNNISHKQELYGIDSEKIKKVLKDNFKEKSFFISNKLVAKIYVEPRYRFKTLYSIKPNKEHQLDLSKISNIDFNTLLDGIILIDESYPYLVDDKTTYTKIYEEKTDKTISIYKKVDLIK